MLTCPDIFLSVKLNPSGSNTKVFLFTSRQLVTDKEAGIMQPELSVEITVYETLGQNTSTAGLMYAAESTLSYIEGEENCYSK